MLIDTQRRRTQIRLAQRAYRERKETTISSLKNQSNQLYSVVEQMNRTFLRLIESLLKSGLLQLNAYLAQEVKAVTETFGSLVKTANEGQYDGEEEHGEVVDQARKESELVLAQSPETEPQDIGWGYSATGSSTVRKAAMYIVLTMMWLL